jgi:hypothetical protein
MKTEELIGELGRDLRPVRRLAPPWRRAVLWLAVGLLYVAAVAAYAWIRHGALGIEVAGPYMLQQVALVVMSAIAAFAAFTSVVPGAPNRMPIPIALSLMVLTAALSWGVSQDVAQLGTVGVGRETDWPCVVSITAGGFALWTVAGAMLRRGAALEPRTTSALAGLAALGLANIEACISRAHTFTATVVVWHGATTGVVMVALVAIGPRLIGTRNRRA